MKLTKLFPALLASTILLGGCAQNNNEHKSSESSKPKVHKVVKKHTSKKPVKKTTVSKDTSSNKRVADTTNKDDSTNNKKQDLQFPQNFQGTWYGCSKDSDDVHTVTFTGNTINEDGTGTFSIHRREDASAQDKYAMNHGSPDQPAEVKDHNEHWMAYRTLTDTDNPSLTWINLTGWLQGAGDGSYYRVANENVDGQQVPVLFAADDAGAWTDMHYYQSKDLAEKNKGKNYSSDHLRDDDSSSDSNDNSNNNSSDNSSNDDSSDNNSDNNQADTNSDQDNPDNND